MPASDNIAYYFELKDFSVVVAVVRTGPSGPVIENIREFPLANGAEIEAGLKDLVPDIQSRAISAAVAMRGRSGRLRISLSPVGEWLQQPEFATLSPAYQAMIDACTGIGANGSGKNLQAIEAVASVEQAENLLKKWNVTASRLTVAPIATAGAVVSWLQSHAGTVAMLDFGETVSHWLVAERSGVVAARSSTLTMDVVAETIREELGLRFKGAAAKLFFNDQYDFTEIGPKIGAKLAARLKPEFASLPGGSSALLFCAGLMAPQKWFGDVLADGIGCGRLDLDVRKHCKESGITFASETQQLSLAWLGLLQLIRGSTPAPAAWLAEWRHPSALAKAPTAETRPAAPVPAPPAPAATPAAVPPAPPVAAVAAKPQSASAPVKPAASPAPAASAVVTAKPTPAPAAVQAKSSEKPAPPKTPANVPPAKAPVPAVAKPSAPAPAAKPAPTPSPKSAPAQTAKPAPAQPAKDVPSAPPANRTSSVLAYPLPGSKAASTAASDDEPVGRKPFLKTGAGMAVVATAVIAVSVIIWLVVQMQSDKAAILAEKTKSAEQLKIMEKARQAEADARKAEEEARRRSESDAATKLAALDAARQKAENEAHQQAAARLANARGNLVVATQPAGANVRLSLFLTQRSPAKFEDVKIGEYDVVISLDGYDEVKMKARIEENQTVDLGVIALQRQIGDLQVDSTPPGAHFELRPQKVLDAGSDPVSGTTPAKLAGLPAGVYSIAIDYKWVARQTGTVEIPAHATATSSWEFSLGSVKITSTPSGATVTQAGKVLGNTPLELGDLLEGPQTFELTYDSYESVHISGLVAKNSTRVFDAKLVPADRLYRNNELDQKPVPIVQEAITMPPSLSVYVKYHASVRMVIGKDGVPRDLAIVETSDPLFGQACLVAAAKWRFKPALVKGKPVSTQVALPFLRDAE